MSRDLDAYADFIVLTVKASLGPAFERIAAAEQAIKGAVAVLQDLAVLRDRIVVLETKASVPLDLSDLKGQLLAQAVALTEAKAALAVVSERVAVVETRAPVPGPPGPPGADGRHGRDGADGLGFDDLGVNFDGDRTLSLTFQRGQQVKAFPIVLPFMRQQGVWIEGKSYEVGDVVTWGGSQWHCNEPTTSKPGDGTKAWTLIVKRGRDGKDGVDAPSLPVVSVGRR